MPIFNCVGIQKVTTQCCRVNKNVHKTYITKCIWHVENVTQEIILLDQKNVENEGIKPYCTALFMTHSTIIPKAQLKLSRVFSCCLNGSSPELQHILFFPGFFCIVHWSCFISSRTLAWLYRMETVECLFTFRKDRFQGKPHEKPPAVWTVLPMKNVVPPDDKKEKKKKLMRIHLLILHIQIYQASLNLLPNITAFNFKNHSSHQQKQKKQKSASAQSTWKDFPQHLAIIFFEPLPHLVSPLFHLPETLALWERLPTSARPTSASSMVVDDAPRWWLLKTSGFPY